MNSYLLTASTASVAAVAFLLVLLLAGRRKPSMPPVLHPGWDDLPTPEPPPTGDLAVAWESTPGRPASLRDQAGAPALGTYRVVCMECGNTIEVSPMRGPSIESKSICRFCAARLRIDKPGFDEPGVRCNETPDFRH